MWYLAMKGSYFLHGGGQAVAGSQVTKLTTRCCQGQLFWIQSIKTALHKQQRNISLENVMLSLL